MKLHRDLSITQQSAWQLAYRIREAMTIQGDGLPDGPVGVDDIYFDGKRANIRQAKRKTLADCGLGSVGKTAIVAMRDRESNTIRAKVVPDTTQQMTALARGMIHRRLKYRDLIA